MVQIFGFDFESICLDKCKIFSIKFSFIVSYIYLFVYLKKALIIAFSSDFLEKFIYLIENHTISGFTEKNLLYTTMLINNNYTTACRYFESKYHGDINTHTYHYYRILVFKLIFVIVYQVNYITPLLASGEWLNKKIFPRNISRRLSFDLIRFLRP